MTKPMFSCRVQDCAEEVSWPADMLRLDDNAPICEGCYGEIYTSDDPLWADLPPFIPAFQATIADLLAALIQAETWLMRITDEVLDGEGTRPQYNTVTEQVRAAIAKAKTVTP